MIDEYFKQPYSYGEVRPEFQKEYISLFKGWVKEKHAHKMDEVTESEWSKFNSFLHVLFDHYKLYSFNPAEEACQVIENVGVIIDAYDVSMNKESSEFIQLIIPELNAVYTEGWDYTWILWHQNNGAVDAFSSMVSSVGLYQFNDENALEAYK